MTQDTKQDEKRPRGQPTKYNEEMAAKVCDLVAEGYTLTRIGRMDGMPARKTIYLWSVEYPLFLTQLQHAREAGFDAWVDECFDIADDGTNDWIEDYDKEGKQIGWTLNGEHIQRSKARIDMRLKVLPMLSARHRNRTETIMTVSKESDDPMAEIYAELNAANSNPESSD